MVASLIILCTLVVAGLVLWVRSIQRRRAGATVFVTNWPEIELTQRYGGWDANAYDAGTGHDRTLALSRVETHRWSGPLNRSR